MEKATVTLVNWRETLVKGTNLLESPTGATAKVSKDSLVASISFYSSLFNVTQFW